MSADDADAMTRPVLSLSFNGELGALVADMQQVAQVSHDAWAVNFARSMTFQAARPGWQPTAKQLSMMRLLSRELHAFPGGEVLE